MVLYVSRSQFECESKVKNLIKIDQINRISGWVTQRHTFITHDSEFVPLTRHVWRYDSISINSLRSTMATIHIHRIPTHKHYHICERCEFLCIKLVVLYDKLVAMSNFSSSARHLANNTRFRSISCRTPYAFRSRGGHCGVQFACLRVYFAFIFIRFQCYLYFVGAHVCARQSLCAFAVVWAPKSGGVIVFL